LSKNKKPKGERLEAKVLSPKRIRRKNISCRDCEYATYSRQDYKILFEGSRLAYFEFPLDSKKTYCNDCLFKKLNNLRTESKEQKISIDVYDVDEVYTLTIEKP
jgi:hypothetical protein